MLVNCVSVLRMLNLLYYRDKEFGRVLALPVINSDLLPSQKIDRSSVSHLTETQQAELLTIIAGPPLA